MLWCGLCFFRRIRIQVHELCKTFWICSLFLSSRKKQIALNLFSKNRYQRLMTSSKNLYRSFYVILAHGSKPDFLITFCRLIKRSFDAILMYSFDKIACQRTDFFSAYKQSIFALTQISTFIAKIYPLNFCWIISQPNQ